MQNLQVQRKLDDEKLPLKALQYFHGTLDPTTMGVKHKDNNNAATRSFDAIREGMGIRSKGLTSKEVSAEEDAAISRLQVRYGTNRSGR